MSEKKEIDYQKVGKINGSLIYLNQEIKNLKEKIEQLTQIGNQLFEEKARLYDTYQWTDYALAGNSYDLLGDWIYEGKEGKK